MVTEKEIREIVGSGGGGSSLTPCATLEEAISKATSFIRLTCSASYGGKTGFITLDCDVDYLDTIGTYSNSGFCENGFRPALNLKVTNDGYTVQVYEAYNSRDITSTSTIKYYAM